MTRTAFILATLLPARALCKPFSAMPSSRLFTLLPGCLLRVVRLLATSLDGVKLASCWIVLHHRKFQLMIDVSFVSLVESAVRFLSNRRQRAWYGLTNRPPSREPWFRCCGGECFLSAIESNVFSLMDTVMCHIFNTGSTLLFILTVLSPHSSNIFKQLHLPPTPNNL